MNTMFVPAKVSTAAAPVAVPTDDVSWCADLAAVLSQCCLCVTGERIAEVRALLANPPVQMLPDTWAVLIEVADQWQARIGSNPGWGSATFPGLRLIRAALCDMPRPVPGWAAQEAERQAMAERIFGDAEGRN